LHDEAAAPQAPSEIAGMHHRTNDTIPKIARNLITGFSFFILFLPSGFEPAILAVTGTVFFILHMSL